MTSDPPGRAWTALLVIVPLLLPLTGALPAHAARTYYVAIDGSAPNEAPSPGDCSGGTEDDPWGEPYRNREGFTIQPIEYGMRCLGPGDSLVIRGGTYDERVDPVIQPGGRGTSSQPVSVRAHPGERVVIRGYVRLDRPDHWHLHGLNVTNDGGAYGPGEYLVKFRGGTGWSFEGAEVWNTRSQSYAAVRVEPASDGPAPNGWRIAGNCIHDTAAVHGEGQDHNLYIWTGPGGSGVIERNVLFNAANGQNIKLGNGLGKGADLTENVQVRFNTMYHAWQNVMVVGDSRNNTIARNLMGHVVGKSWYPNVRGYSLSGSGNAARDNAAFTGNDGPFVLVGKDDGGSTQTISTSGNLFPISPQFDSTSRCDGLYPTESSYRGFGAYAPTRSGDPVQRVAGTGRIQTAIEISEVAFPSASTVLIARADTYPDALAGAPLAAAVDAPILLSARDRLSPEVGPEIRRLGARRAILLGGTAALSDQVRRDLEGMDVTVERAAGHDRFSTAVKIAHMLAGLQGSDVTDAYVVEGADPDPGRGWPDAVAVGSLAAQQGRPILLVTTESLPEPTRRSFADLGVERATLIGGTASISGSVQAAVDDTVATVRRTAGTTRFHTSRLVADESVRSGADPARTWFATGGSFPDALTAGPAVAQDGGVLLLVPGGSTFLNAEATDWLDHYGGAIERLRLIGGAAAIGTAIEDKSRYEILHR